MKTKLLAGAAALLIPWSAMAADLGGNCCVDLEERVAELEATVARKGNRKVSLEVSGHVHEMLFWRDEIEAPGEEQVDLFEGKARIMNDPNNSGRFRFKGSAKINQDWSAGFLMELGVSHNAEDDPISIRHQALYVQSRTLGTVWLGHTSMATDGVVELDLSNGSTAMTLANPSMLGGGIMDGGRADIVRYISPTLGGFVVSGAWADEDVWDAALRFAGEFGGFRLAAGVGYAKDDEEERVSGSASISHLETGLFASGMFGRLDDGTADIFDVDLDQIGVAAFDAEQWGARVGLERKWNSLGATTIFAEYSQMRFKDGGGDLDYWGAALVQSIDAAAMDVYIAYRRIEPDLVVGEECVRRVCEDVKWDQGIDEFKVGAKIKF
jgi:predicted porin